MKFLFASSRISSSTHSMSYLQKNVGVFSFAITLGSCRGFLPMEICAEPFANGGRERIAAGIPVGRIATPDDIAFPTVSLCFDGARHITGEILNVNGGSVLCG